MIAIGIQLKVGRRNSKLDLTYRNDHPNLAPTICFDRYANTAATRKVNIFALFPSIYLTHTNNGKFGQGQKLHKLEGHLAFYSPLILGNRVMSVIGGVAQSMNPTKSERVRM
jgi:hypothetical protein